MELSSQESMLKGVLSRSTSAMAHKNLNRKNIEWNIFLGWQCGRYEDIEMIGILLKKKERNDRILG